jgi:hypothetical protein
LDAGAIAMHLREYALADRRNAGERKLARAVLGQTAGGVVITPATAMWNNGVTGVHARDFPVLDRALTALDDLMGRGVQSFYLAQLTLSMAAEGTGRLIEAAPWFVHYWANKPGWTRAIADRLADHHMTNAGVDALVADVRAHPIALPLDTRARGWRRWLRRLSDCPC